ncbi:RidA family protein [Yersinia enterocolitica]|uniref:RidA family protein n=1 Tax=Yersinia enterocolitica TaxID=630 RepID=UPI0021FE870B|nr:Bona fide RidA/YjgF/TdcF/RutC subgroup [Yersinia enterocolitica]HDL7910974.1 RidA family protein [Yersinia enterocolitica]
MMSEPILINSTSGLPPAGHYSHAVCAGGMIYLSGQLPVTPLGMALSNQPFDIQVKQVFTNIEGILADCHCTVNSLVQVRVYLCDIALWSHFNALYADWLGPHKPARCIVPVPVLHHDLALEIEVVALLPT